MSALYLLAGINHFINPRTYLKIMPPWVPYPQEMVLISGVFEILFALLLLPASTRPFAAWGIIVLLIAVFPANIQMSVNYHRANNPYLWVTLVRLLLQPVLIWWAYKFTTRS
ncbi:MAG: DoxX family protein [Chitinophagaceae bacterium]